MIKTLILIYSIICNSMKWKFHEMKFYEICRKIATLLPFFICISNAPIIMLYITNVMQQCYHVVVK